MGSPNVDHRIGREVWDGLLREGSPFVKTFPGALFTYQFFSNWVDTEALGMDNHPRPVDFFTNTQQAIFATQQFTSDPARVEATWQGEGGDHFWGLSAAEGPYDFYFAEGAPTAALGQGGRSGYHVLEGEADITACDGTQVSCRPSALGGFTYRLNPIEGVASRTLDFETFEDGEFAVNVRYSNDHDDGIPGELVTVRIDGIEVGSFRAEDTGSWDVFVASGEICSSGGDCLTTLTAGTHQVEVSISEGDGFGIELDAVTLSFERPLASGTAIVYGVGSSILHDPQKSIESLWRMSEIGLLHPRLGFADAFNLDVGDAFVGFVDPSDSEVIRSSGSWANFTGFAIDHGPMLIMIDNYLSGNFVPSLFTSNAGINSALQQLFSDADLPRVFVVDSTADGSDVTPGDGVCQDMMGQCTLFAAIEEANALPNDFSGPDVITFNIPGAGPYTIQSTLALPAITDPVVIDGTTQPGFTDKPLIELDGILTSQGTSGLTIRLAGGGSVVRGLTISGFPLQGIFVSRSDGNLIEQNFIGTDPMGVSDRGNGRSGVHLINAQNNVISNNLISGNDIGVSIVGPLSTSNSIKHNAIGTDVTGATAIGNTSVGVAILGAPDNTVGGTTTADANLISGNKTGIEIRGAAANGNRVQGNAIGTDIDGGTTGSVIPNRDGVVIQNDATGNVVGGNVAGAGNVISGNQRSGVKISRADGNIIQGNVIGTDVTGSDSGIGNGRKGIEIITTSDTLIGGAMSGEGNVISGNGKNGVLIRNDASNNRLEGNTIGSDPSHMVAIPNPQGIVINDSPDNIIGGTAPGAGNFIAGNISGGIRLIKLGATGTLIQGNQIGDPASGVANVNGVFIAGNAHHNTIGGTDPDAANVIAGNSGRGVWVTAKAGKGNAIQQNMIYANGSLGIDLNGGGVTDNDAGDVDDRGNDGQNFPVITSAVSSAASTTVTGSLDSTDNETFTIEFFANSAADPSGYGEGEMFIGATMVTTDGNGHVDFSPTFAVDVPSGHFVTATATDSHNSTSEFSKAVVVSTGLQATGYGAASTAVAGQELQRRQLLTTVVMRELGHVAGLKYLDGEDADDLMDAWLKSGTRRTTIETVDAAFTHLDTD